VRRSSTAVERLRSSPLGPVLFLTAGLMWAWIRLWHTAPDPKSAFGGDLAAYQNAAHRLVETGSPYADALLAGPIRNVGENIPIGYFYPPPLSQLFVPIANVGVVPLQVALLIAQSAALALLIWALLPSQERTSRRWLVFAGYAVWSWPMQAALYVGNVSVLVALGFGAALIAGPRAGGLLAAGLAILKFTPAPLAAASLFASRTRAWLVGTVAVTVIVSYVLAPTAWRDWLIALPNILRTEMRHGPGNLSPAQIGESLGFVEVGTLVGWAVFAAAGLCAVYFAWSDHRLSLRAVACAAAATTFASATAWDHYFAVFFPLHVYAWTRTDSRQMRLAIVAAGGIQVGMWVGAHVYLPYRILVVLLTLVCVALLAAERPVREVPDAAATQSGEATGRWATALSTAARRLTPTRSKR
jgi:hypothetical protein